MRILLVTLTDLLPVTLGNVLNPKNEYCAIVVDEPEPARELFRKAGLPENIIYPLYELKECIENFYYDCLLFVSDGRNIGHKEKFRQYGLPKNKFVHLNVVDNPFNFLVKRALQYYQQHSSEFEMFATGISYAELSLDTNQFKRKLFNFGRGSQDLYYDYQIAKFVLSKTGGG